MADSHAILKNGTKEIAHGLGKAVTFMSKWNYGLAGSSSHVHVSLWDAAGKTPLFYDPKGEFGMSALMRAFVAGQLAYARGDEVVDHYVHTARWEQFEYDRRVTDWELMRGFERY